MSIHRAKELIQNDLTLVNDLIISTISAEKGLIDELSNHLIQSGGKRIRPILILLASHACGYKGDKHISLAAMIEFFHTATLLHDDVVDDSDLRRGRETANNIWGSKASILVGDYLFTLYIDLMIKADNKKIMQLLSRINSKITRGEIKQLNNKHNINITMQDYYEVISAKTSLLFAASTGISAIISDANPQVEEALYNYGLHLGNAFQIIDDMLDYSSTESSMGKSVGDDLADSKITLPLIYILENGSAQQINVIKESISLGNKSRLPEVLEIISETKALNYTQSIAEEETHKAIQCLDVLADSKYKNSLTDLARYTVTRDN